MVYEAIRASGAGPAPGPLQQPQRLRPLGEAPPHRVECRIGPSSGLRFNNRVREFHADLLGGRTRRGAGQPGARSRRSRRRCGGDGRTGVARSASGSCCGFGGALTGGTGE